MWTMIRRQFAGQLRAIHSRWKPLPIRVENLQVHQPGKATQWLDWVTAAARGGVCYEPAWKQVEDRLQSLLVSHPAEIATSQAEQFMGGVATFEYIHVNHRGGRCLSSIVAQIPRPTVVEVGTAFGVSGMYMLSTIREGQLWTFDPCTDWREISEYNLSSISSFYERIPNRFEDAFPNKRDNIGPIDFAFVDGLHTYENVTSEFELLEPSMRPGSIVAFHDVELDDEMKRAWAVLRSHERVIWSAFVERQFGIVELA